MRNSYLVILSCLVSIPIIYVILFIHTFFNLHNEFQENFKSLENLNFHEKYSKKIHHIREKVLLEWLWKKPQIEDLLFTTITNPEEKEVIVLFQGDSWMEQLTSPVDDNFISVELVKKFKSNKKIIAYGAPAKAFTMFSFLEIDNSMIDFCVDTSVTKIGKVFPKSNIPVISENDMKTKDYDTVLITAWNYKNDILGRAESLFKKGTKLVFPLTEFSTYIV